MSEEELIVWTIGHSTRTFSEFFELLTGNAIQAVADVRRYPVSRKYPHFNHDALRNSLAEIGIEYVPLPELGGRRRPRPDSQNTAWRNESFRGYADYMESGGFRAGVGRLLELAHRKRTAVMCAEAVWWRCHRSLIADYLKSAGICVRHIIDRAHTEVHPYTSAARIRHGRLSYAPGKRTAPVECLALAPQRMYRATKKDPSRRKTVVSKRFEVGDHVSWNSEAGRVSGRVIKVHTRDIDYKGHTHYASADDPQYEIKSDKTDHIALHKGSALRKVRS